MQKLISIKDFEKMLTDTDERNKNTIWYLNHLSESEYLMKSGLIKFTEDSACCLAGPFEERYGLLVVEDCRNSINLKSLEDKEKEAFEAYEDYGKKYYQDKEAFVSSIIKERMSYPSIEKPFHFLIHGTDDTSYHNSFGSMEKAEQELNFLLQSLAKSPHLKEWDG